MFSFNFTGLDIVCLYVEFIFLNSSSFRWVFLFWDHLYLAYLIILYKWRTKFLNISNGVCQDRLCFIFFVWVFFHTLKIHGTAGDRRVQLYSSPSLPPTHDYTVINFQVCNWNDYCVFLIAVHVINNQAVTRWDWTIFGN